MRFAKRQLIFVALVLLALCPLATHKVGEAKRQAVNQWIRTSSDAGYKAMAEAIDVTLFK